MDPTKTDPAPQAPEAATPASAGAQATAQEAGQEAAIPEAVVRPRRKLPTAIVWLIPAIAIGFALWAVITAFYERGSTITIAFKSGEGIEARKTKIKYKNVDIGEVRTVTLSDDRQSVIVTAQVSREAESLLVDDTRFWVVRPRVSAGSVTGLGTLLVGSHIGLDAGKSTVKTRTFTGLEQPPTFSKDLPGRQFVLRGDDLGSLDIGSPIYFRHIQVGQVTGFDLDADGKGVTIGAFINSPYDKHVNPNSRFWFADGFDVTLDANGLKINTQSVLSILIGGLAFETLPDLPDEAPSPEKSSFRVFYDRAQAMKATYSGYETFMLEFKESVRGLTLGAPLDFRGVIVGEVVAIDVKFDPVKKEITVPVRVRLYPERLRGRRGPYIYQSEQPLEYKPFLEQLVQRGFRAQLRTANLLTAQLYVALDFFPGTKKATIDWNDTPPEIPTIAGSLQELQATLASIASKLDKVPFDKIATQLTTTLENGSRLIAKLDGDTLPALRTTLEEARKTLQGAGTAIDQLGTKTLPEAQSALSQLKKTLASIDNAVAPEAPLRRDLQESLREVGRAAKAFRVLADYLERHPEALLRGRGEDPK
ncbi:MAG: MlaD family protein [Betaproteobacteria bacterium]